MTERPDVDVRGLSLSGVPIRDSLLDVEPDHSLLVGVRAGYWFAALPEVGIGIDVSGGLRYWPVSFSVEPSHRNTQ